MWNQYCPPTRTHMNMNAGEDAEEVLKEWDLLLPDETGIEFWGLWSRPEGVEIPQKVFSLFSVGGSYFFLVRLYFRWIR